jgi:hypothetical protein
MNAAPTKTASPNKPWTNVHGVLIGFAIDAAHRIIARAIDAMTTTPANSRRDGFLALVAICRPTSTAAARMVATPVAKEK